jgi:hypothetical protein
MNVSPLAKQIAYIMHPKNVILYSGFEFSHLVWVFERELGL